MLSTTSQPVATGTVLRRKKDGSRVPVECPDSIILYNKYMGGVDRGDQLRGYYCRRPKSSKFYKYLFYFLFDVAITNAFILYYKHFHSHPSKSLHTVKEFRLQLAKELIGTYCSRRVPGRCGGRTRTLQLQHFPLKDCRSHQPRGADVAGVSTAPSTHTRGRTALGDVNNVEFGSAMTATHKLTVFIYGIRTCSVTHNPLTTNYHNMTSHENKSYK